MTPLTSLSGHGKDAVQRMRQLRVATRAYAIERPGPVSVLDRLDRFVHRLETDGLATLWYGEYQPSTGTLAYASGGHPRPSCTSTATRPTAGGRVVPAARHRVTLPLVAQYREVLPLGSILVAYSDGLVERHDADSDDQIALLEGIVDRACDPARAGTAETIAEEILTALVPDPNQAQDDVCLLVVRRRPSD